MNDILKFNVFGENFEIKTNDLENTNFIFNILGSNCKNNHIANKESYIFEYNFDNNYIPKIHKKGIKYELLIGSFIYDKNNQEYNIFYKDGSYAKWLFLKKKFIFYIKKIYNKRNMFFQYFLDPLSIAFLENNKIIFHGALLVNKTTNEGVALLGKSGYGKTSISIELNNKYNYEILSDDVFCIIDKQLNCQGINVGIGIKKSLDKQPIDFDSVLLTKSKKYYFQNIQYQNTIKLSKVIILGTKKNNIYQIELLNNYNFIKNILNYQTNILSPFLNKKINLLINLANNVDKYIVNYPNVCNVNQLYMDINETFCYDKLMTLLYNEELVKNSFEINSTDFEHMTRNYIKSISLIHKKGVSYAIKLINTLFHKNKYLIEQNTLNYSSIDFCNYVSKIIPILRKIGKENNEGMLCLERSISLCTALITIGIPSQVVIGKSSYHITNLFEFHSWVEIDEIVITDSNIIKKQFIEISRFPVLKV
ncbi:putative uncharacterized protein [Staphylococcus sp. CAG:324]|jgi:hypothetical protein|nr:hypothetical protein [Bacilli bacterium]MBS6562320.1 lasso peptide biosynthesis protein [Staphylococcus sp.]CDC70359.1 putative uncharacterized protein [Staphylococcus sp. CAG:324]